MTPLNYSVVAWALAADVRRAAQLSREGGFAGLLVDAYGPSLRVPDLSGTGQREFLGVFSAQNQKLVGLQVDLGRKGLGIGADVDRLINGVTKAMEAARGLASPLICVEAGPLPEPAKIAKPKTAVSAELAGLIFVPETPVADAAPATPPPDPAFVGQVDGALAEIGSLADRLGVVLAFRSELSSFAAIDDALGRARCPWFGVDLDPVAVLHDAWPMDEVFSRLGPLVRHVRGRDAIKGADRRTKPAVVGRGDTPWGELLAALDGAGYAGWMTVDPMELTDRLAGAKAALAEMKRVGE